MTYQQALSEIHALPRISSLETMAKLMHRLGDPQDRLHAVHIAGTNGKGSTAAMTAFALRAAGYHTGLFVSPFILSFRERFQLDGEMIPQEQLAALTAELLPHARAVGGVGEFAFLTALAFCWFARQRCDICVIEVGLGGRLDATNLLKRPLVSVITRIGLDHTALLGETLEAIAYEKCGIIKPHVPVVVAPDQPTEALATIYEQAALRGADGVYLPSRAAVSGVQLDLHGSRFCYDRLEFALPLIGAHQVDNALTAYTALALLQKQGFVRLEHAAILRGMGSVVFPARLELLQKLPPVLLDGAHNPQGMAALADALQLLGGRPVTAIIGMLSDKDSRCALGTLLPHLRRVYCVAPENPRALAAEQLAAQAGALGARAVACASLAQALEAAERDVVTEEGALLICGSLYLASEARAAWRRRAGESDEWI